MSLQIFQFLFNKELFVLKPTIICDLHVSLSRLAIPVMSLHHGKHHSKLPFLSLLTLLSDTLKIAVEKHLLSF